ncbi:MAG TPA: peptidoglycan binding domain-containing protein, partial [Actinomycetes bacterium]|nr:peptidoglycan binding domain-containing protein [Actinomycetes bacterium]
MTDFGRAGRVALVASGVVAVLVLAYVGAYLWVGGGIPRGTTVVGVDIGGMSDTEAVDTLNTELGPRAEAVSVDLEGSQHDIPSDQLGLAFDPVATVASVPARDATPQALLSQIAGQDVEPVVTVDEKRLDHQVKRLAHKIDDPVRQPRIEYDDLSVVVIAPQTGSELDQDAATQAILNSYLTTDEPIPLAAERVVPYVSEEEAQAFADTEATEAVSAPITLTIGGTDVEVSPDQIADVLSYRATSEGMTARVDAELLRELIAEPLSKVGEPARDATFDVSSGTPQVVPARTGRGVDDESLASGVIEALESST